MIRQASTLSSSITTARGTGFFDGVFPTAQLLTALIAAGVFFGLPTQICAQNPATSVAVDANANQHPINPNVYGVGGSVSSADVAALNAPLNRIGGDLTSTYNWQLDALNLSQDWYFESYLQDGPPVVPGASYDSVIQGTYNANVGSEPMVTLPMLPYIATIGANATPNAASLWSYSVAKYGAQVGCGSLQSADPYQSDAGSGCLSNGSNVVNNPADAYVPNTLAIQKAFIQHLISKWGLSTTATGIKYYVLDNEPSLWSSTHRDVHPSPETYDEEYNNIVNYATAIRALDPNAKIVGPEEWIWWAMFSSGLDQKNGTGAGSDYATHSDTYYYPYLLQKLYAHQQSTGIKMLDVLTVHCYTDFSSNFNVATRELWDPNFVDPNWEGPNGINLNGGIQEWIPLMKEWVSQYYPGLEIGCTEYNWGNQNTLEGATAQADAEGIYGLYGFDLATIWTAPPKPTYLAMQMYRNYDGKLSTFGDTSVSAGVANPDNLSAFAAVRTSDGALTVMVINKQQGSTPVTVSLANFGTSGTAQAYQISSASQTSITSLGSVTISNNSIVTTVPSQSVTLFVVPSGSVVTKPAAPTGLAANVGNGSVTLTWNAGGGATSYTVSRGTSGSGPFSPIGTVTSPALTTFTNSGLANGTTYYYVVSGTNKAGTGPNSSPVSATPLVPPTFTSSASAAPNPVTQNATTTITAQVKCTANTLANGTVEIIALDPNSNVALTKTYTAQNFSSGQTQSYSATLTPAVVGTYALEVEVTSASGQQWSMNTSAGSVTVNTALSFSSVATATPLTVAANSSTKITATVKNTGSVAYSNGNVLIQIFASGASSPIESQTFSSQNIAAGGSQNYSFNWTPPADAANGAYALDVGVFDSTWATDYYWNTDATITVTGGTGPPTFTSKATAKPTSITTYQSSVISFSVTDTGGPLTNGNVEVQVYNSSNTAVGTQVFSGQNFAANGTHTYTYTWTPSSQSPAVTALGNYTVDIGVFDSAWSTNYSWNSPAATISIAAASAPAITSPKPSTTFTTSPVTFSWNPGLGVSDYELKVGTAGAGSMNLYNGGNTLATSQAVTIPSYGVTVYVRLLYEMNGAWKYIDYTYTEPGTPTLPTLTTPKPGSTLTNASTTFTWTPGAGPAEFEFKVGTTGVNSENIYNGGIITGTSATVSNLPATGVKLYVRLWYQLDGTWKSIDYTYTAP